MRRWARQGRLDRRTVIVGADENGEQLVEALKAQKLAGAGLDVYEREPAVHPHLIPMPNVVLAPHIASATVRTRSEMSAMAARNMATAVRGGRPPNLLNPEVKR